MFSSSSVSDDRVESLDGSMMIGRYDGQKKKRLRSRDKCKMELRRCEENGVRFKNCRAEEKLILKNIYTSIVETKILNASEPGKVIYDSHAPEKTFEEDCHG